VRRPRRLWPATASAGAYASARLPGGHTPWREATYCVVDLELTGLDARRDEIISFGAVPVIDGRVAVARAVYGLARPSGQLSVESVLVHGIRTADLAAAPPLDEAIGALLEAITGRILVVHAASVERAFLAPALRSQGVRLRGPIIDTRVLGRLWLLQRGGVPAGDGRVGVPTLAGLAEALGLPSHRPHHALGDALTTAQVFLALATHLDGIRRETVRSLARADHRVQSWLVYPHRRC
jgi:DNA polymerase-3 subunit epsilon